MLIVGLLLAGSAVQAESIRLTREHGILMVPVLINSKISLNFTLDSGASDVSIPANVFSALVRAGTIAKSDLIDIGIYKLADGSTQRSQRFRIRSLKIGKIEIQNVTASVVPAAGVPLLGQTFLARLHSWSIDNQRQLLTIGMETLPPANSTKVGRERPNYEVPGPPWQYLMQYDVLGRPGPKEYIDVSSIRIAGPIRRAWLNDVPIVVTELRFSLTRWAFNCGDETYRLEASVDYYRDGHMEDYAFTRKDPTDWQVAIPNSPGYKNMQAICAWKSK